MAETDAERGREPEGETAEVNLVGLDSKNGRAPSQLPACPLWIPDMGSFTSLSPCSLACRVGPRQSMSQDYCKQ